MRDVVKGGGVGQGETDLCGSVDDAGGDFVIWGEAELEFGELVVLSRWRGVDRGWIVADGCGREPEYGDLCWG